MQMNIKVRIGGHASDRFTSDRECNALELLLCTPLSIREMVAAEFRALRRHFILPALTIIALLLLGLKLSQGGVDKLSQLFTTDGDPSFHRYAVAVIASAILFLIIDTIALAWAGAWCGLACRKIQQARSSAMALVTVIPIRLIHRTHSCRAAKLNRSRLFPKRRLLPTFRHRARIPHRERSYCDPFRAPLAASACARTPHQSSRSRAREQFLPCVFQDRFGQQGAAKDWQRRQSALIHFRAISAR
jgi:hypothetical protein